MDAYKRARMVLSATEDNDEITPVYRLEEICDLCRSSPPDVVKDIVDHVMRRLDNRSPYVKQKALRLIKYASGKAGPDFKRDIQRHSGTIRGYFHFKGQPDPLKGDAPNKAVRDTAHETVQAMFNTETSRQEGPAAYPHRKMEGFGSQGAWDPGANASRAPAGIGGYLSAGMKELETAVLAKGGLKDMVQGAVNQYTGRSSRRSFLSEENDQGSFRPPRSNEDTYAGDSWSGGGGGYRDSEYRSSGDYNRSNGSFGRGASAEVWTNNQADNDELDDDVSMSGGGPEAGSSKGPATAEERLVDGITAPGGVRPSPTRDALQAFMNAAATLDGRLLGQSLESKLRSQRWQVRFRALCVIEALQRHEGAGGIATAKEHFVEQPQAVMDNLDSPQASVREKAKKVLSSLGLADSAPSVSSPASNAAPVADLLDTSEPTDFASSSPLAEAPATDHKPQTSAPSADLLGDAFWSEAQTSAPSQETQASGGDLFTGLTVGATETAQKPGGGDSSELFAGMNLEGGTQAQPTSVAQASSDLFGLSPPKANAGGVDSLNDLLGGLSVEPQQATPSTASPSGGVRPPPQSKQPLPPMFGNSQFQQPQNPQGFYPQQGMPGMMPFPQQMTPQQMQHMQMAYLHQMQQRGMAPVGMMPFPQPGFGGFMQQPQYAQSVHQNGSHMGGGLQPSGGSLGASSFSSLGAGGSGDLFLNAGIAHSQENKAETKAFDFIADQLKTAKTGKSMR